MNGFAPPPPPDRVAIPGMSVLGCLQADPRSVTYAVSAEAPARGSSRFLALTIRTLASKTEAASWQALCARLQQAQVPGVLAPIHQGTTDAGDFYYSTELYQHDLTELPACSDSARLKIVADIARALAALHEAGLAHGRLARANILLQEGPHGWRVGLVDLDPAALDDPAAQSRDVRDWARIAREILGASVPEPLATLIERAAASSPEGPAASEVVRSLEPSCSPGSGASAPRIDEPALEESLGEKSLTVTGRLGEGSSAIVYAARDATGQTVAVKVFHASEGGRRNLERIGRVLELLRSFRNAPFVVPRELGTLRSGHVFYTMEAFPRTLHSAASELELLDALDALCEVSRALGQLHRLGLVHRDVKPGNVLVQPVGDRLRVVLADFGLAAQIGHDEEGAVGTLGYRAPESGGAPAAPSEDVWSWAATAIAVLSRCAGKSARGAADMSADRAVAKELSWLPPQVTALIEACLALEPGDRPDADQLTAQLSRVVSRLRLRGSDSAPQAWEPARLYKGLQPFTAADREWFHGRDEDVERCAESLDAFPLVVLVGSSGVGKTSFVHAGLLPRLREAGERGEVPWRVLATRPRTAPFLSLAQALIDAGFTQGTASSESDCRRLAKRLRGTSGARALRELFEQKPARPLIVIDQFEELLTIVDDGERDDFAALLSAFVAQPAAALSPRILVAVRDDLFGPALPLLGEQCRAHHLGDLDEAAMQLAIERPARRFGYELEEGLSTALISQIAGAANALTLLQLIAGALWHRRDRYARLIRRSGLDELGGVKGAIDQHARSLADAIAVDDEVWRGHPDAESSTEQRRQTLDRILREVMVRLVDADNRSRRPMPLRLLLSMFERPHERLVAARALARCIRGRLLAAQLPAGAQVRARPPRDRQELDPQCEIELAHESMISGWSALRAWLAEEAPRKRAAEEVSARAGEWLASGRATGALWRGSHYQRQRDRIERLGVRLTADEAAFWSACEDRWRLDTRRRRSLWLGAAVAFAVVCALAALLYRSVVAERGLVRRALIQNDRLRARALAIEGRAAMGRDRVLGHERILESLAAADTPEGRAAARAYQDMWTAYRGRHTTAARVQLIQFSPRGDLVASATGAGELGLWPLPGGVPRRLTGAAAVTRLAFDREGRWVYWRDANGATWRLVASVAGSGDPEPVPDSHDLFAAAAPRPSDPAGQWNLVLDESQTRVSLAPAGDGAAITLQQHGEPLASWAWDPARRYLAWGGSKGSFGLWHLPTDRQEARQRIESLGPPDELGPKAAAPGAVYELRAGWFRIHFVYVPGGIAWTGCSPGDQRCERDRPWKARPVRGFWIGRTEVTQSQYAAIIGSNPSSYQDPDFPVSNVSWHDAVAFCSRLSALTGARVRLPTELEWEHAARAGSRTPFHWGTDARRGCRYGNVLDEAASLEWPSTRPIACDDGAIYPALVGSYAPNRWGLYDTFGNVREMAIDTSNGMPADLASAAILYAVVFGGSYAESGALVRVSDRRYISTRSSEDRVGFRVVLEAAGQ